jgi:CDP-glucose 4,6-dehydratase
VDQRQGALEELVMPIPDFASFYGGRRVLVTGHTGFKGGWLTLWLHRLGAEVHGYSLDPPTTPSLFNVVRIRSLLASDTRCDVLDLRALQQVFQKAAPEVVFHLAAQPLVRASYRDPVGTLATNIMGTANVLEAARHTEAVRAVVLITTDKVYENREWPYPYREVDRLGGHDPYSASKASAEIVAASYRQSFFNNASETFARIATARAGNVIGGGDWSPDRLLPDCVKAFQNQEPVVLRYPHSVRPWQHVLEPLQGYLKLGERLSSADGFARAWNFGPPPDGDADVFRVASLTAQQWGGAARVECAPGGGEPHETGQLRLDSTLAGRELGWRPGWALEQALSHTVRWYRAWAEGSEMATLSREQICAYEEAISS